MSRLPRLALAAAALHLLAGAPRPAGAYIEAAYTLGRLVAESTNIVAMQVEKVDKENNRILYRKIRDIKGKHPTEVLRHNIAKAGFHPREWQNVMAWAEPGKMALFFYNGGASETCIDLYWYQCYGAGPDWGMSHAEPFLLRSYAGRPEKLALAVEEIMANREVVVPAMIDDKNSLHLRNGKIQRLRASLKLTEYNAARDFIGWGSEDFRRISFMPGFSHLATLSRVDPDALGAVPFDYDNDGDADVVLHGETKTVLVQVDGGALAEVPLPYAGGARQAAWADWNGDKKPDLLLAAPDGARLLTQAAAGFRDDSSLLPRETYGNVTAACWTDYDGDGRPDIVVANGVLGLRLYRNPAVAAPLVPKPPRYGPWHFIAGFDNAGGQGFEKAYPPETEFEPAKKYPAKGGHPAEWKQPAFPDGQVHSFLPQLPPHFHNESVAYLLREIECETACEVPASFGSDDTLTVWVNGKKLLAENVGRGAAPDQNHAKLPLAAGRNRLLVKICNGGGEFGFYFSAKAPESSSGPPFEDWTAKAGLGVDGRGSRVKGSTLVSADFDGDGLQDLFYGAGSGLFLRRLKDGGYSEDRGIFGYQAGSGTPVFADLDGDKDLDLVAPQAPGVKIFRNDGGWKFTDVTAQSGDLAAFQGRASSVAAVDLFKKGRMDLVVGCFGAPNRYFRNAGAGRFQDATRDIGLDTRVMNTRAVSAADVNKDGTWDLIFVNEGQEPALVLGDPNR